MRYTSNLTYFFAAICFFGCSKPAGSILAVTHVTVIDATGAPARPDMTVLINDRKIAVVGGFSSVSVPRNAQIIDASGESKGRLAFTK